MKYTVLLFLTGALLWSADVVNTPVVGLVREAEALRPLHGLPGALDPGGDLVLPEGTTLVSGAPRQEWLLLERTGEWLAFDWQRGTLLSLGHAADLVAFSNSGREAVLVSGLQLRLVSGLPAQARIVEYEMPGGLGKVERLAVSEGATHIALYGEGRVLLWQPGAAASEPYRSAGVLSLTFMPDSHALLVADLHQNAVLRMDEGQSPRQLLGNEDGLDVPSAVWAGSQGRLAAVSNKRELLWTYDHGEWRWEAIPGVAGVQEMQLRDTLLLTDSAGHPLRIHAFGTEQRTYEVPRPQMPLVEVRQ
ncbi:MAG: hypothetical protein JNK87_42810 [Bryobacterales bacterium]|nr:hypothetical protein [Bryobacterales bacterium]